MSAFQWGPGSGPTKLSPEHQKLSDLMQQPGFNLTKHFDELRRKEATGQAAAERNAADIESARIVAEEQAKADLESRKRAMEKAYAIEQAHIKLEQFKVAAAEQMAAEQRAYQDSRVEMMNRQRIVSPGELQHRMDTIAAVRAAAKPGRS